MAGGKGKLVGRQNLRPAVRLELTRALPLAQPLQKFEYANPRQRGASCRANRGISLRPAVHQQNQCQRIPQPSIAQPGGRNHPITNPARRAPPVQSPHHAVIAPFDKAPYLACDGHGPISRPAPTSDSLNPRVQVPQHPGRLRAIGEVSRPLAAKPHFVHPVPGGNHRHQRRQRQQRQRCRLLLQQ